MIPAANQRPTPLAPQLYGTGTDGPRVQAVYIYSYKNDLDQPAVAISPDFPGTMRELIQHCLGYIDACFLASAQRWNGTSFRRVRWVTDAAGKPDVAAVYMPPAFNSTGQAETFAALGQHSDRLYLAWLNGNLPFGGEALGYKTDTQIGSGNLNNTGGRYACVGISDWYNYPGPFVHELAHLLGAVQWGAPYATSGAHVNVIYDLMGVLFDKPPLPCSSDGAYMSWCLDCSGDSYYNPTPKPGSYLARNWNTANSEFLIRPLAESTGVPALYLDPANKWLYQLYSENNRQAAMAGGDSSYSDFLGRAWPITIPYPEFGL